MFDWTLSTGVADYHNCIRLITENNADCVSVINFKVVDSNIVLTSKAVGNQHMEQ